MNYLTVRLPHNGELEWDLNRYAIEMVNVRRSYKVAAVEQPRREKQSRIGVPHYTAKWVI